MKPDPLHFRIAGVCAMATAACAVAGAIVSIAFGLGGQNLPLATHEDLANLAERAGPFLWREWFYLLVVVFALGEGWGLYLLLRESTLAIWALITWMAGVVVGIVEDAAVIGLIQQVAETYPSANPAQRDALRMAAGVAFETIKVQQCVSVILCSTMAYCIFSMVGYRLRRIPLWLCIVGVLSGITTGLFTLGHVLPGLQPIQPLLENGYTFMVIWDFSVGVLLLSAANRVN